MSTFKAGYIYRLNDPERYDDENGTGFDHVLVPDDMMEGMHMVDCWPVNRHGDKHPGYDISPIPVRIKDVDIESAHPFSRNEPRYAEPYMESAGAELMNLAWRMQDHPDFSQDAQRIREIGSWISMNQTSDLEKSLMQVVVAVVGAIRKRNIEFRDDLPIASQFIAFLDSIPDPLPGEQGYIDQATLPPLERKDIFEAKIEIGDVRTWEANDGTKYAQADCLVAPINGVAGEALVFAQDQNVDLLVNGATKILKLRSARGALKVEG